MSEKRRELYARLGLQLLHNRRAFEAERAAEGAMAVYLYCVMYARAEMTDGFVPVAVVEHVWGRSRVKAIKALVTAGLLLETEAGVTVAKYAEHNDARSDVESNREAARERMRRVRRTSTEQTPNIDRTTGERSPDVPISISFSVSDQGEIREESIDRAKEVPVVWVDTGKRADPQVTEVWEHYVATMAKYNRRVRKKAPNDDDRKNIRQALKSLDVEACKLAIDGLFLSSFHLGHNDRGKEYLGLFHAFKPNNVDGFILAAELERKRFAPKPEPSSRSGELVDPAEFDALMAQIANQNRVA